MASTSATIGGGNDFEFAPVRDMNDFLLESARFQIPPYRDLQRWSNRILSNLLYYQTNYFVMILILFLIVGMIHPKEMLLGFLSVVLAFAVFAYATSKNADAVQFKREHPLVSLGVIAAAGYFTVLMFGSVIVFLFGIALPMLLMFLHASTRLRNLKNKIAGKLETVGLKKTPMGRIFDLLGLELELIPMGSIN